MLHLVPVPETIEQEEIRVLDGPRPLPPLLREWEADNEQQTIKHIATGCQFRAYPVEPAKDGLVTPFARRDVAVRFAGIENATSYPSAEQVREIGRQGIEWIMTYTFEARRK